MRFPLPIYLSKHHEYRKAVKISLESIIQNFFHYGHHHSHYYPVMIVALHHRY
jgi:hypothetical protein